MNKLEQNIIDLLKAEKKELTTEEIAKKLNISQNDVFSSLKSLQEKLKVKFNLDGTYKLLDYKNFKIGIININHKGVGFVNIGNKEIRIPIHKLNGAIQGDTVLISIQKNNNRKLEGKVLERITPDFGLISGVVYFKDKFAYVKSNDLRSQEDIKINNPNGIIDGSKVLFKIIDHDINNTNVAQIIKTLDYNNNIGIDVIELAKKLGIKDYYPDKVLEEEEKLPTEVEPSDLENRRDLRNELIFTIDGNDAKDLDDAISLKTNERGNYVLGIHIADVSHYVPLTSEIGKEAYKRGTSVYLINHVIPMLPRKLSNGICSLTEGVDRLTLTCEVELTKQGKIVNYDIFESVINSKKKMTYSEVNNILEKNKLVPGYEPYVDTLKNMLKLSQLIRKQKEKRGTINFGINETYIKVNENGEAVDVTLRVRGESEKIIEDFMILANETVAEYICDLDLPFLYRIHPSPDEDKINKVIDFIASIGYEIKKQSNDKDFDCAKTLQMILTELKDSSDFVIISKKLIRCMKKANYSSKNEKHFGIASEGYTHFTAPIRRYPDLVVHHLLKKYIIEKNYNLNDLKEIEKKLNKIAKHISTRETVSDNCEREVIKMKHAEYMEKHIGEEFEGWVSNITSRGMYVQLENLIQGLISANKLEDSFVYDPRTITLTSVNYDLVYKIGSHVKIVVEEADKEKRMIGFSLAKEKEHVKTYKL